VRECGSARWFGSWRAAQRRLRAVMQRPRSAKADIPMFQRQVSNLPWFPTCRGFQPAVVSNLP
jgi:hypothetical protein